MKTKLWARGLLAAAIGGANAGRGGVRRRLLTTMAAVAVLAVPVAAQQSTVLEELIRLRDTLTAAIAALSAPGKDPSGTPTPPPILRPVHTAAALQAALDAAVPGTILVLDSGTVYSGNFTLPARPVDALPITITSAANVPTPGVRPDGTTKLAIVSTPNNVPAISASSGAHGYRLVGLRIQAGSDVANDLVRFGYGTETASSLYPSGFVVDRCVIRGSANGGAKRGILANAHDVTLIDSDIRDIWRTGQDTTAFGCFNCGTGYVLRGNWLEAGAEVVIFGGAESAGKTIATDVLVEDNVLTRPIAWKGAAVRHQVKNLFELKEGLRVTVRRNHLFNNWAEAQPGTAIVITPRDIGKSITDVLFESNVLHDTGAGFSIASHDDHVATPLATARITLRNNLVVLDQPKYGGDGRLMIMTGAPADVVFDHNTLIQLPVTAKPGSILAAYETTWPTATGTASGGPVKGLVYTNNVAANGEYGFIANGHMNGSNFPAWFPGVVFTGNVLAGYVPGSSPYPGVNRYPTIAEYQAMFVNFAAGDYRPSPLMPLGTDGKPAGADFSKLPAFTP